MASSQPPPNPPPPPPPSAPTPGAARRPPALFSQSRIRRQRRRALEGAARGADFLKQRVAADMMERLDDSPRPFARALDLGSHSGALARRLAAREGAAHVTALDPEPAMAMAAAREAAPGEGVPVEGVAGSLEALPFREASFDLVASALALHLANDLPGTLAQARRVLVPDGLFLACLPGAGTLPELRESLLLAETERRGGAAVRLAPLPGLRDCAALLQRAGFALPVADSETVTVRYSALGDLLADLGAAGERSALADASGGLSRGVLERAGEIYRERFSDPDGRLRATVALVWLSGWSPGPGQPVPLKPGSAKISLSEVFASRPDEG